MVRQISVYIDDWQFEKLQAEKNKSEAVREALTKYYEGDNEMKKQEAIEKLEGISITKKVTEWEKIAEDKRILDEIIDWLINDFADNYDGDIKESIFQIECTRNGIRYYCGREERFLDIPIGEEGWEESQWDGGEVEELYKEIKKYI